MRIAVIGSGISGLTAAYLLAPHAQVTLYEKDNRLGGHAHTALLTHNDTPVPVDTGFMVFNPSRYPYFISLLQSLGIDACDTNMSFSVSIPREVEYSGSVGGIFGDLKQLLRPTYWRFLSEIPRFNAVGKVFLLREHETLTMGAFLDSHGFSRELAHWYVYPMIGSIWSTDTTHIHNFSARETLRFLDNHQLLSIVGGPQWKTIPGGSKRYVDALTKKLQDDGVVIKTNQRIQRVTRSPVRVHTETVEQFDAVVLATHADDALNLLADASPDERDILNSFSYAQNTAILHRDVSFMPKRKSAWAAWNYHGRSTADTNGTVSLTYNMNYLQHIPVSFPVLVTLNPQRTIPPELVFTTIEYSHPVANAAARAAQKNISEIQGNRNTYFCGAHWGNGFHEDGVVSAMAAVKALNVPMRISI